MSTGAYPGPEVPRLSLRERDRRWARVREAMRRDNLDVILALHNSSAWDQGNGNGRYLSSIGGNCAWVSVVFPADGEVTAVTGPVPTPNYWMQFQDWVSDIRGGFFDTTPAVIDRLRELGMTRGRIGIAGLSGVARQPDGLVSAGTLAALGEQLPDAEFVNATKLLYEARAVKSPEEVAMLKKATRIVDKALDVFDRAARPGVPERLVYARMMEKLIASGSEPTTLLLWAAGNPLPPMVATMPSKRRLGERDAILVEVDAKLCGYLGHASLTKWLGPIESTTVEMAQLQYRITQLCWDAMRPGARLTDLVTICSEMVAGTPFECTPILHSRGQGFDAPVLVGHPRDEWTANWVIPENAVFVVKPMLAAADGSQRMMWGDTVVVTPDGAKRLGKKPPPLVDSET